MAKQKNKLTPVEWEIMEAIWALGGSPSIRDVVDNKYANGEKAYTTIQTVMNTLEKKGLLSRKKIGLVNFYTPVLRKEQIIQSEMSHVISRLFKGSIPAMANYLIQADELGLEEIQNIKKMIQNRENELKGENND